MVQGATLACRRPPPPTPTPTFSWHLTLCAEQMTSQSCRPVFTSLIPLRHTSITAQKAQSPRNFGIFTHWNFHSLPLKSNRLPFAAAVSAFNVTAFAAAAAAASASFVVFTATWASFYVPAPITAVDDVLLGRTAERDLLGQIMHALQEKGIKLILYLHYGKDDPEWWAASRFPLV